MPQIFVLARGIGFNRGMFSLVNLDKARKGILGNVKRGFFNRINFWIFCQQSQSVVWLL